MAGYEDDILFSMRVIDHPSNAAEMDALATGVEKTMERVNSSIRSVGRVAGSTAGELRSSRDEAAGVGSGAFGRGGVGGSSSSSSAGTQTVERVRIRDVEMPTNVEIKSAKVNRIDIDPKGSGDIEKAFSGIAERAKMTVGLLEQTAIEVNASNEDIVQSSAAILANVKEELLSANEELAKEFPEAAADLLKKAEDVYKGVEDGLVKAAEGIKTTRAANEAKAESEKRIAAQQKELAKLPDWQLPESNQEHIASLEQDRRDAQENAARQEQRKEARRQELEGIRVEREERRKAAEEQAAAEEEAQRDRIVKHEEEKARWREEDEREQEALRKATESSRNDLESFRAGPDGPDNIGDRGGPTDEEIAATARLNDEYQSMRDELKEIDQLKPPNFRAILEHSADGAVKLAKGLALLGIASEDTSEEFVKGVIKIQGYADAIGGAIQIGTKFGDFLNSLPARQRSATRAAELTAQTRRIEEAAINDVQRALGREITAYERKILLDGKETATLRVLRAEIEAVARAREHDANAANREAAAVSGGPVAAGRAGRFGRAASVAGAVSGFVPGAAGDALNLGLTGYGIYGALAGGGGAGAAAAGTGGAVAAGGGTIAASGGAAAGLSTAAIGGAIVAAIVAGFAAVAGAWSTATAVSQSGFGGGAKKGTYADNVGVYLNKGREMFADATEAMGKFTAGFFMKEKDARRTGEQLGDIAGGGEAFAQRRLIKRQEELAPSISLANDAVRKNSAIRAEGETGIRGIERNLASELGEISKIGKIRDPRDKTGAITDELKLSQERVEMLRKHALEEEAAREKLISGAGEQAKNLQISDEQTRNHNQAIAQLRTEEVGEYKKQLAAFGAINQLLQDNKEEMKNARVKAAALSPEDRRSQERILNKVDTGQRLNRTELQSALSSGNERVTNYALAQSEASDQQKGKVARTFETDELNTRRQRLEAGKQLAGGDPKEAEARKNAEQAAKQASDQNKLIIENQVNLAITSNTNEVVAVLKEQLEKQNKEIRNKIIQEVQIAMNAFRNEPSSDARAESLNGAGT